MNIVSLMLRVLVSISLTGWLILGTLFLIWIDFKKRKRQRALHISLLLPNVVEVIALYLSVGLAIQEAITRAAAVVPEPVNVELDLVVQSIGLGMPISDAMHLFVGRTGCHDGKTLALLFHQADRFGSGTVDKLQQFAENLRERRLNDLERVGKAAPIKMLIPLILFIFPALLIVLFAPILIKGGLV